MARKILIVDDEPNIVISLEFLMQQRGYEVALAHDGEQALQRMETFRPDLVLLDVVMPAMDGYEVCRKIRERSDWNPVRILMLSAKARDVDVSKGLALGADAYMTKPFSTRQLMATVGELLAANT
ncbi:response regulator transcription factor [Noviherbaspirillum sp. UKPF54]|uniref:response regulator transcription factor n=1 Tax=Noviherbaspirillum sp. UKPF54 TaxID=2601898 RepID=UPI0011B1059C|nr:response regulator [Noviherbaspirillum sp. UKPF54]QDZ28012.1 response regulator [Noviherbaspirillum sp. UKPF54]